MFELGLMDLLSQQIHDFFFIILTMHNNIRIQKEVKNIILILVLCFCSDDVYSQNKELISWKEAQGQSDHWYASDDALRIADNVILYQNNNGGWLKNLDMAKPLSETKRITLQEEKSKKTGTTIDNGATYTQMRFLAKVYIQTNIKTYKQAFLKGLDYLLEAQYENGGWPQYYPLREGYYTHITFNDNAMIGVMNLLRDIARNHKTYNFVDKNRSNQSKKAIQKALDLILEIQVRIDGKLTLWCAQYHREDLSPAKARAYELPSLSGAESVGIVNYLMKLEQPSEEVKRSIEGAVSWFEEHKITGKKVIEIEAPNLPEGRDRVVVKDKNAVPLWGRFNEIGTGQTIFVGRDGVPKSKLSLIEHERRIGYSYLGNYAESLLNQDYPRWVKRVSNTN